MSTLNLPEYNFKIKRQNSGKLSIFDRIRGKYVALTPEEFVRQNFIEYLIQEKHYPANLIANEVSITFNGLKKRCDSLVYRNDGSIALIIEFKAPDVPITQKTFDQMAVYNMQLDVNKFIISNGTTHFCGLVDKTNASYQFLDKIPEYSEL